ncbi:molybdopterin converting factor subunit 1 [Cellvibrio mixtus]|uniref:Molybdopterin synthase sulfur carrier subunit n=1 Tax=Cellvibrio mixtus TaxID=39650 RepID=A0A266Q4M0_9GAMM|nr:molybdopterin converting factor subunit 1 [Cellvibrio mixtus]OZY84795.1 molybdopterin converting factor subunit 1 [Cellvibrio mixtus]
MIRVVFLAQLREQLGCAGIEIDSTEVSSISELKQYLLERYPEWSEFLEQKKLLIALNHEYARSDLPLVSGDEVAFFPPVTGG